MQNPSPGLKTGVYYRLMLRQSLFGRGSNANMPFDNTMEQSSFFKQPASQVCLPKFSKPKFFEIF